MSRRELVVLQLDYSRGDVRVDAVLDSLARHVGPLQLRKFAVTPRIGRLVMGRRVQSRGGGRVRLEMLASPGPDAKWQRALADLAQELGCDLTSFHAVARGATRYRYFSAVLEGPGIPALNPGLGVSRDVPEVSFQRVVLSDKPDGGSDSFAMEIDIGHATAEDLTRLLVAVSRLHQAYGGAPLAFTLEEEPEDQPRRTRARKYSHGLAQRSKVED